MGILPEALFNFLALLGWSPKDNREFFTKDELINLFDLDNVNKAPAIFDFEKLKWMNHKYIVDTPADKLYEIYREITPDADKFPKEKLIDFIETMKEHFDTVKDIDTLASTVLHLMRLKKSALIRSRN